MAPKQPGKRVLVEQTFGEKMEVWYDRNGKWLNIVLGVVVVGVLGWVLMGTFRDRAQNAGNVDFRKAVIQYEMGLMAPEEAEKIDQIQGSITAAQEVADKHADKFVGRQAQLLIGNAHYNIALVQTGEGVDALGVGEHGYAELSAGCEHEIGSEAEGVTAVVDERQTIGFADEPTKSVAVGRRHRHLRLPGHP